MRGSGSALALPGGRTVKLCVYCRVGSPRYPGGGMGVWRNRGLKKSTAVFEQTGKSMNSVSVWQIMRQMAVKAPRAGCVGCFFVSVVFMFARRVFGEVSCLVFAVGHVKDGCNRVLT